MQHRLLQPGPLLDRQGRLAEAGYALSPIKTYDRAAVRASGTRIKEWDYYLVSSDACCFALTVADLGYLAVDSLSFIDLDNKTEITKTRTGLFPMGRRGLAPHSGKGVVTAAGKRYEITLRTEKSKRHLYGHMYDFGGKQSPLLFDFVLDCPPDDSMVIATPFYEKDTAFYYNQKINCMPADGRVIFDGREYLFSPASAFGVLDWGRGVWTYRNTWYWASASGVVGGRRVGFNLGYGFGDTSQATENMVFVDGMAIKLGKVQFCITTRNGREDYLSPWTMYDDAGRLKLSFVPILDRRSDTNLLLMRSNQHQIFGRYTGAVLLDSGEMLPINSLVGFAEKVCNKW